MCLAIGHKDPINRGIVSRSWWYIARSPLRLYSFGAVFHGLVLLLLYVAGLLNTADSSAYVPLVLLVFGMLGWSALGFILEMFPSWFRTSVTDYSVFGLSYNLAFVALLLLELGLVKTGIWLQLGMVLLLLAWLTTLRNIYWIYLWGMGMKTPCVRSVKWLLNILFIALVITTVLLLVDVSMLGPILWLSLVAAIALIVALMAIFANQMQRL